MTDNSAWLALQVWGNHEFAVQRGLCNRGYEVFVPTYQDPDRNNRPLFVGYVFCRSNVNVTGKILTQPGVLRIVGIGRRPVYVPEHELEALRRLTESELVRRPWSYLPHGTQIRVESGPLKGVQGTLVCGQKKRALILSVHILQRSTSVELDERTRMSVISVTPRQSAISFR